MAQNQAEWLEQHAQRLLDSQKGTADTAKLLATFVAAIAATLVATALQVRSAADGLDIWAVITLAASVVATLIVILLDRLECPDHDSVLAESAIRGWAPQYTLSQLRVEELAVVGFNNYVLDQIRLAVAAQVVSAIVASVLASTSLLSGQVS